MHLYEVAGEYFPTVVPSRWLAALRGAKPEPEVWRG
jgi:hypothetical protein